MTQSPANPTPFPEYNPESAKHRAFRAYHRDPAGFMARTAMDWKDICEMDD